MEENKIIIWTDGGARGNPGPAAIGIVADLHGLNADSRGRKEYSQFIGETTNNIAEYKAVIFALKKAKHLLGKKKADEAEIEIRADSELLCKQLNGQYRIKDADLQPLFIEVWNLKQDFKKVDFTHIPREHNKDADRLVNRALDRLDDGGGLFA